MIVLALDPGPIQSGVARFDGERVLFAGVLPNEDVLKIVADDRSDLLAIEKFMASGQSLGNESLETVRWEERFRLSSGDPDMVRMVPRLSVKKVLGLSQRDGDKQVNARLAELIGPKGTKAAPGPCFGVSSHSWAALGVAYAALRL